MAIKNQSGTPRTIYGTNAERLAIVNADIDGKYALFYETDTNAEYEWKGSKWVQTRTNGAAHTTSPAYTFVTYSDATYTYYCEAVIGTARSTAAWQVSRKTTATGDIVYAGTGAFAHAATSLAIVTALTYTLGV